MKMGRDMGPILKEIDDLKTESKCFRELLEKCLIGGNSLASVLVGLTLPPDWLNWDNEQASNYFYDHYENLQAYEYYEMWLCWRALKDASLELDRRLPQAIDSTEIPQPKKEV